MSNSETTELERATQELAEAMAASLKPYVGRYARPIEADMFSAVGRALEMLDDNWTKHVSVEGPPGPVDFGRDIHLKLVARTSWGARLIETVRKIVENPHAE